MGEILIIQLGRLGDLVQTLPIIGRIKEADPDCRITLLCLREFRGIIGNGGGWDRLVQVSLADTDSLADPERGNAFPNLPPFDGIPELALTYDLVVNLTGDLGSSVIADRVKAARKLGRTHTYQGELRLRGPWAKYLYAMVRHRKENLFNLVDIYMGMTGLTAKAQPPALDITDEMAGQAREIMSAAGWSGGRPLVALQAGASDLNRAWDLECFADLASLLVKDGAEVLLVGDPKEAGRAAALRDRVPGSVIDLVGKTTLGQLPAVIKACELLVSNDTGTIHVAAAVGTPSLGLFFSTAYYSETAPYGAGHAILQVEIPCSPCNASSRCPVQVCRDHLPVSQVHETVRWLLRPGTPPPPLWPTLSLYQSRFLDNGTLLYAPARSDRPSGHYLTGLMGRLVWEGALGITRDRVLEETWRTASTGEDWRLKREELGRILESWVNPLNRGLVLAGQLRQAFVAGNRDLVKPLHAQLAALSGSFSDAGEKGGLFVDYLHFEMMDLDYAPYPELATHLEEKYRSLTGWISGIRDSLDHL